MKAVHFGAGKIGRGFIGVLLSRSGYEVCFVARNEKQIGLMQQKKQYNVIMANETNDISVVKNITAININNDELVSKRIAEADLITTAVGASSLKHIAEVISKGIELRLNEKPRHLHIIACENVIGGSTLLKKWVYSYLRSDLHELADRFISFPNSIIDRIVPDQKHQDPLTIKVEPFFEWIIQRPDNMNGFREIHGVKYADSLEQFIERKLFTVNTGHCCAAYFGYLEQYLTIQGAMKNPSLRSKVEGVLKETGNMLIKKYGLDEAEHRKYIQKTLERFANPALTDKVLRVGRSPLRKLSPNDRLVRPALQAYDLGIDVSNLVSAMAAALMFNYQGDPEAVKLQDSIRKNGIRSVISKHLGIPDMHPIHQQVAEQYEQMNQEYKKYKEKLRA